MSYQPPTVDRSESGKSAEGALPSDGGRQRQYREQERRRSGREREERRHGGQERGGGVELQGREFPSRTYLSESARQESIRRLNGCLADTTVLLSQARYAHWNVKGPNFYQFHELFEELADALEDHVDDVGERAASLGGEALGTTYSVAANSGIEPLPRSATDGLEFASLLADRLALHDANLSKDIEATTRVGDVDTADLLNEISRSIGTYVWFLEAHLQGRPTDAPAVGWTPNRELTRGQERAVRSHSTPGQ